MAKGFKHGAGGGASLNFKVVGGTTEPASPKENTIWVNTDAEITSWIFSASEPENPSEGMVWVSTGTSSAAEFNALKKNGIMVYPMSAKQYVGGAWLEREAKSYQSGEWVEWLPDGALYWHGNEFEDITGGFTAVRGTLRNDSGTLTFTCGTGGTFDCYGSAIKISKGNAKKLSVNIISSGGVVRFGVCRARSTAWSTDWLAKIYTNAGETGVFELDISSIEDPVYVLLGCGVGTGQYTFTVDEIRMYE